MRKSFSVRRKLLLYRKGRSIVRKDKVGDWDIEGKNIKKVIVTGLEPATSRPVILRSTIDLHDQPDLNEFSFNI